MRADSSPNSFSRLAARCMAGALSVLMIALPVAGGGSRHETRRTKCAAAEGATIGKLANAGGLRGGDSVCAQAYGRSGGRGLPGAWSCIPAGQALHGG